MGIKLTDEQIEQAMRQWGVIPILDLPEWRAVSDAATAHAVREIGKKLKRYPIFRPDGTWYTIKLEDWQALLVEAGVKEAKE